MAGPLIGKATILQKLYNVAALPSSSTPPLHNPVLVAGTIVRGALTVIGLIFLILTVYGGALYLTAGGNEETVKKAKSILARAVIGMLIVLFAGAITQFITKQILTPSGDQTCITGDTYSAEWTGVDFGCERPGYTLTGTTCECTQP